MYSIKTVFSYTCFSHVWGVFPVAVGAVFTGMDIMVLTSPMFWVLLIFSVFVIMGLDLTMLSLVFLT